MYLSKLAVARRHTGQGLGGMLTRWLVDQAAGEGARVARVDVWKTNQDLRAWYRREGWAHVRTVDVPAIPVTLARPAVVGDGVVTVRGPAPHVTLGTVLTLGPRDVRTVTSVRPGGRVALDRPVTALYEAGTTVMPMRNSGALYERPAVPDREARGFFTLVPTPEEPAPPLEPGVPVITAYDDPAGPTGQRWSGSPVT